MNFHLHIIMFYLLGRKLQSSVNSQIRILLKFYRNNWMSLSVSRSCCALLTKSYNKATGNYNLENKQRNMSNQRNHCINIIIVAFGLPRILKYEFYLLLALECTFFVRSLHKIHKPKVLNDMVMRLPLSLVYCICTKDISLRCQLCQDNSFRTVRI